MFVDVFYFRTNGEMPKMKPSLHYENIQVFSSTSYKFLIDFRTENNYFMKLFKVFNFSKSLHTESALT